MTCFKYLLDCFFIYKDCSVGKTVDYELYDKGMLINELDCEDKCIRSILINNAIENYQPTLEGKMFNNIMRTSKYNGKKIKAYKVVKSTLEIIEKKTKSNPVQVLIHAIQNSAPKEETTRLRFGGISVPKAVDTSPQRRLDLAIRNISIGAVNNSHKNKKHMEVCLSEEIIKASKNDVSSFAVAKKNDAERIAKSAR